MTYLKMCEQLRPLFNSKQEMEATISEHRQGHPEWNLINAGVSLYEKLTATDATQTGEIK